MIFNKWYREYQELKQENEYYTRECWKKQEQIRELKKRIKELEEEVLKNEKKSKRKNTRLPKNK